MTLMRRTAMATGSSLLDNLPKGFRLRPPTGKEFFVFIFETEDNGVGIISNRNGEWETATELLPDLAQPEQKWGDWDIEPVDITELPKDVPQK